jgi:hypothetical protein
VPVSITVELDPHADDPWLQDTYAVSLEAQLINAIVDTPTPVDLPGTPLSPAHSPRQQGQGSANRTTARLSSVTTVEGRGNAARTE